MGTNPTDGSESPLRRALERGMEAVNSSVWLFVALCGGLLVLLSLAAAELGLLLGWAAALVVLYGVGFILLGVVAYSLVRVLRWWSVRNHQGIDH